MCSISQCPINSVWVVLESIFSGKIHTELVGRTHCFFWSPQMCSISQRPINSVWVFLESNFLRKKSHRISGTHTFFFFGLSVRSRKCAHFTISCAVTNVLNIRKEVWYVDDSDIHGRMRELQECVRAHVRRRGRFFLYCGSLWAPCLEEEEWFP